MDKQTLKSLYRDYGYAVHRRCLHVLGNPSDADDVMQDVFIRAYRYGHTFDGKNPLGWLYRIADRQCINAIKKHRRMALFGSLKEPPERETPSDGNGQKTILGCVAREIIRAAKRKDAEMAMLYYVDEMTQEEVAKEMGCSRKTVRKRLSRFKDLARDLETRSPMKGEIK